jgi:hypothetical protein
MTQKHDLQKHDPQKHDPEITPLPAPLPGLSIEIDALASTSSPDLPTVVDPPLPAIHLPGMVQGNPAEPPRAKVRPKAPAKVQAQPAPQPAPPVQAPVQAHEPPPAIEEKETTDPELAPAEKRSRSQTWWIIGGLALFALGVGSGALIWQPTVGVSPPLPVVAPPVALPLLPPSPVSVTPIVPTVTQLAPPSAPTPPIVSPIEAAPGNANPSHPPTARPAEVHPPVGANPPPGETPVADAKAARVPKSPGPKRAPAVAKAKPDAFTPPPVVEPPPPPSGPQKQLSQATIRQTMLTAQAGWSSCVKDAFGSNLSIGIAVNNAGQVQKADILGPLAQSSTGRCITGEIRKLHFPPFTEGTTKQFFWSYQIPAN